MSPSPEQTKKKTRRRLRVSCVECARRRQKCDRMEPCGLCKSRGVEHLCRWELEPFARPPPSRPSATRKADAKSPAREETVDASQTTAGCSDSPSSCAGGSDSIELDATLDHEVKEAAIALAQLSVARHGEILGTGSLVCALHSLNDSSEYKIPIDKSSGEPFSKKSQYTSIVAGTFISMLQSLISNFPDRLRCDTLIMAFFEHENWRYGLRQTLILSVYDAMWKTIQEDPTSIERIDFHWVTFLFIMLALSPACSSEEESRRYFLQALTGKRLAEDVQLASFFTPRDPGTFSQGTAHGCIAASLMAKYMCDRGQMTEAWKVVGSAVRNAQNAGLHVNPAWHKWKDMTVDEQALRKLAWHMCASTDRFLSFALGRPAMVHPRDYYVPIHRNYPSSLAADGSSDANCIYHACLGHLLEIVSEEKNKFLCIRPDATNGADSFDKELSSWEASLPPYFACREPHTTFDHIYPNLRKQRAVVTSNYFFCCMLFHRSLPSLQIPSETPDEIRGTTYPWDFEKLTHYAIELLNVQRSLPVIMERRRQLCFTMTYFVYEAAVTLSIAVSRDPKNVHIDEWRKERDAAIDLLQSMDNSELTQQAILVLRIIQDKRPANHSTPISSTGQISTEDLFSVSNVSSTAWPLLEPQSAMMASLFPLDAFQSQSFSSSSHMQDDVQDTFSAFDLLFRSDQPM